MGCGPSAFRSFFVDPNTFVGAEFKASGSHVFLIILITTKHLEPYLLRTGGEMDSDRTALVLV